VLSPYLYLEHLSELFNDVKAGCFVGNNCINHILFVDDICLFRPSLPGLQDLLDVCSNYAQCHDITFNCTKSFGMLFSPKCFKLSCNPVLNLAEGTKIFFVDSVRYLGISLNSTLQDDEDIFRLVRSLYGVGNKLRYKFLKCFTKVKNKLYRSYCMSPYGCQLWCKYREGTLNRLRVAYNGSFRLLHNAQYPTLCQRSNKSDKCKHNYSGCFAKEVSLFICLSLHAL